MKSNIRFAMFPAVLWIGAVLFAGVAGAQEQNIDAASSTMTVKVYKAGAFSVFAHDHEIAAPIASGKVDVKAKRVELEVKSASLKVADRGGSEKGRPEVQQTMAGPMVLDVSRFPQISFKATGAEPAGENAWRLNGQLSFHGEMRPVVVAVAEKGGHYVGSARLKQTDFGIKPIRIAGGAVRVKDEVQIDFDIQLTR